MAGRTDTVPMEDSRKVTPSTQFNELIAMLINLMSNTTSTSKGVFLHQLISRASNRQEILSSEKYFEDCLVEEAYISVKFDGERDQLMVSDSGIGITQKDLMDLGAAPKDGTKAVIGALQSGRDLGDIRLFDVGFFTVFAAADKVTIESKHSEANVWYMWKSPADEGKGFTVQQIQDPGSEYTTQITLDLKEDVANHIRRQGLDTYLRAHNCSSPFKIKVLSLTVINNSSEGSRPPRTEVSVGSRYMQEHTEDTPRTSPEAFGSKPTNSQGEQTKQQSTGQSLLQETPQSSKGPSPRSFPASSGEAVGSQTSNSQVNGTRRKSTGQSPSDTPKSSKLPSPASTSNSSVEAVELKTSNSKGKGTKRKSTGQSPLDTPKSSKTPGSTSTPSTSRNSMSTPRSTPQMSNDEFTISTLASMKDRIEKNATFAVKVMKLIQEGKEKPESGKTSWYRGSYEVVDSTDVAVVRVHGSHDMNLFKPKERVLLHNTWIKKDHIAVTKLSTVKKYEGEIKTVENIKKKRRDDESRNIKTLKEIKENPKCDAGVRVHISEVDDVKNFSKPGQKGQYRILKVKERQNSSEIFELVTFGDAVKFPFEGGKRCLFPSIIYNAEKKNFQTRGNSQPKFV